MLETTSIHPVLDNAKKGEREYLAISYAYKPVTNYSFARGWIAWFIKQALLF